MFVWLFIHINVGEVNAVVVIVVVVVVVLVT